MGMFGESIEYLKALLVSNRKPGIYRILVLEIFFFAKPVAGRDRQMAMNPLRFFFFLLLLSLKTLWEKRG